MATSSFFNNVVIDTEEKFKNLVIALEKSERSQANHGNATPSKATDADKEWIREAFGKSESKR
ncbi:MAG: hypothetical protein LBK04_03455 [Clostridiales Family XIII bacterium]|jgi:hypothetical protein|nr:hypothetical protein [Clostridiales Family XIII bacterium]